MQQGHASFVGIAALMFVAGIGIPLMATLNAGLGKQLASPAAATFVLYVVGLALASGLMLASGGMPAADKFRGIGPHFYMGAVFVVFYIVAVTWAGPRIGIGPHFYMGAVFVVFYIVSVTWAGPKIGIGNAVFFVLLGQLIAAAAIDHYGLWGAVQTGITPKRVLGIAVMALGVYLARKPV